jgi:hypothetical protein
LSFCIRSGRAFDKSNNRFMRPFFSDGYGGTFSTRRYTNASMIRFDSFTRN